MRRGLRSWVSLCVSVWGGAAFAAAPPIIDMHLHAHSLADYGGGARVCMNDAPMEFPGVDPRTPITIEAVMVCANPVAQSASDETVMRESLAALGRHNIYAVTSGPLERVEQWRKADPARVIPAISFLADEPRTPEQLRGMFASGRFAVFAEIGAQYRGLSLDDAKLEPYFALAEELDIPVGVHLGEGPPGGIHVGGNPDYRVSLGSPLQLEPVLVRHPKLRLYVMHFGSPFVDEMIALLYSNPQVYVDVAQNDWGFPRAHFYSQLRRLVDAGFGKRILWGSDQMIWPHAIDVAIDTIEKAPFLSQAQKRDIFYHNAVRFLRLPRIDTR
ncbi:MAG TPA: amidohydrolase family protein [Steroidobacteraceae bacterium]|nr:amidohydrolase family protein [Steroidobacteraceae bacterium]